MPLELPSVVPIAPTQLSLPASIYLTLCATVVPHQAGIFPIFSENTETEESVRDEKGKFNFRKRNTSFSSNIQPRRISSFAALHNLSWAPPTESANWSTMVVKQSRVQSDITLNSNIRRYKLSNFRQRSQTDFVSKTGSYSNSKEQSGHLRLWSEQCMLL